MFFRKLKFGSPKQSIDELSELDSEIAKFESLIESAPQKLREQRERERTTMPAPDDFADRRRERRFYAERQGPGTQRTSVSHAQHRPVRPPRLRNRFNLLVDLHRADSERHYRVVDQSSGESPTQKDCFQLMQQQF